MLHDFLAQHRERIIREVVKQMDPDGAHSAYEAGVPVFLDELGEALREKECTGKIAETATHHAILLHRSGLTVSQVVNGYGAVCQVVTGLAIELDEPIATDDFRTLNLCLDQAIAGAVTEFVRLREESMVSASTERLGSLAEEIRKLVGGALLSFDMLRAGTVPIGGSTGAIMGRSLLRLQSLVDRSLVELRVESGLARDAIPIAELVEAMEIVGFECAKARAVRLKVNIAAAGSRVLGDRELLASALNGLVENAIKFTPMDGGVVVSSSIEGELMLIDVADECGGLANDTIPRLFAPAAGHRSAGDGLGLGLVIMRRAVRAMGGEIAFRNVPGTGCVFTLRMRLVS